MLEASCGYSVLGTGRSACSSWKLDPRWIGIRMGSSEREVIDMEYGGELRTGISISTPIYI